MDRIRAGRISREVLVVLAFLALVALLLAFTNAGRAVAQGPPSFLQNVFVTNTATDPVPVELIGPNPVPVDLIGSDPVPVELTGDLTVEIEPRVAFQRSTTNFGTPTADSVFSAAYDVPAHQRLVIESASVYVRVPAGEDVTAKLFANGPPETFVGTQHFVLSKQGTFGGEDVYTGNQTMLLWAGPGVGSVTFQVVRAGNVAGGTMAVEVSAIGYFEDLP